MFANGSGAVGLLIFAQLRHICTDCIQRAVLQSDWSATIVAECIYGSLMLAVPHYFFRLGVVKQAGYARLGQEFFAHTHNETVRNACHIMFQEKQ